MQVACSTSHQPAVMQMFKDGGGFRRITQLLQWISLTFKPRERGPLSVRTGRAGVWESFIPSVHTAVIVSFFGGDWCPAHAFRPSESELASSAFVVASSFWMMLSLHQAVQAIWWPSECNNLWPKAACPLAPVLPWLHIPSRMCSQHTFATALVCLVQVPGSFQCSARSPTLRRPSRQ